MIFRVSAPPGGKTSIDLFGGASEPKAQQPRKPGGVNECQVERNKSSVFVVGSDTGPDLVGVHRGANPYKGKRQESSIQFGGVEAVEVKPSIRTQPNAQQSHVFDSPDPAPQPKQPTTQATTQPTTQPMGGAGAEKVQCKPTAQPAAQQTHASDKPTPQPAKKAAETQPKPPSKQVEEKPKERVKTSVHVLAPPGGTSSIVFG